MIECTDTKFFLHVVNIGLLLAFIGMSLWVIILLGIRDQLKGYIKRLERGEIKTRFRAS